MKLIKTVFVCLSISLCLLSCNNQNSTSTDEVKGGPEYTSEYVCPMHCDESGSETVGTCPVCGMDYVKKEDHISDGHVHKK